MIQITFVEHGGTPHTLDIPEGMSLMQAAVNHNVPGIDADCGGSMTCGTCRVCVPLDAQPATGERSSLEQQMLEFSGLDGSGVRLSCQLVARPELNGLRLQIPESQL